MASLIHLPARTTKITLAPNLTTPTLECTPKSLSFLNRSVLNSFFLGSQVPCASPPPVTPLISSLVNNRVQARALNHFIPRISSKPSKAHPIGFQRTTFVSGAIKHPRLTSSSSPFIWRTIGRMSTSTLSAYLSEQKAHFLKDEGRGWTMVMGNEAGDLDSLASSIGYAWFLSHTPTSEPGRKAIALIVTSREDFILRAENLHALQLAGIGDGFQELLCPEDLPKPNLCTEYALVDHNSVLPKYAIAGAKVTAIIDHHEDEREHLLDTASPRIIEPSGSCASLVTRLFMTYPTLQIPPEVATLLLTAIVIDTQGLRKGGKGIAVDHEAGAWLLPRADVSSSDSLLVQDIGVLQDVSHYPVIQSLSETLSQKKVAISHLNTRDLLRRDYKEYDLQLSSSLNADHRHSIKAGLATVPLPLSAFFSPSPPSTAVGIQAWMKERGLSILGVLTTYRSRKGKGRREQLWVVDENWTRSRVSQCLFDGLEANDVLQLKKTKFRRLGFEDHTEREEQDKDQSEAEDLDEEGSADEREHGPSPFGEGLVVRVYKQKNASATRKQVAPALKKLLEG